MELLKIGMPVDVGWNGAKYFTGDTWGFSGRIEAIGFDWIVIRESNGTARAATAEDGDFSSLEVTLKTERDGTDE